MNSENQKNPWLTANTSHNWPDEASAIKAQAPLSLWDDFVRLVALQVIPDQTIELDGKFLKEMAIVRGHITIAFDQQEKFLSLRRNLTDLSAVDNGFSMVELEVFWCPCSDQMAFCGYRIRSLGDPSPVTAHWLARWQEFTKQACLAAEDVEWRESPSHTQLTSMWAASGNVNIDLAKIERLQRETDELQADLQYQVGLSRQLRQSLTELKTENNDLRNANKQMSMGMPPLPNQEPQAQAEQVKWEDLDGLEEWSIKNEEHITILPRAINACKKSDYESPDHIRMALEFLAGPYRQSRLGLLSKEEMDEQLLASGTKLAGSVGISVAGNHGDDYFVSWMGRRRILDLHLARGGGRATRYCMRIYFFWCEESQKTVVGWLPSHLLNSLS